MRFHILHVTRYVLDDLTEDELRANFGQNAKHQHLRPTLVTPRHLMTCGAWESF
jgi:hypothetical protein